MLNQNIFYEVNFIFSKSDLCVSFVRCCIPKLQFQDTRTRMSTFRVSFYELRASFFSCAAFC